MNARDRRMIRAEGLNYLENLSPWLALKYMAETVDVGLTLYVSSGRFRYALYRDVEAPIPVNSRSNRVLNFQEVINPHSPATELAVFDYFVNRLGRELNEGGEFSLPVRPESTSNPRGQRTGTQASDQPNSSSAIVQKPRVNNPTFRMEV